MSRKAIVVGGKRDEIISIAMDLFFEFGYEATSVRMIMDRVGGEIGMFYHYFKSKNMLFDEVVDKFFKDFRYRFEVMVDNYKSLDSFVDSFLFEYSYSIDKFKALKNNMHWSIQYSMFAKTLVLLKPSVVLLINNLNVKNNTSIDILAGQILYGVSATIHSDSFELMEYSEKKKCLLVFINSVLYGSL